MFKINTKYRTKCGSMALIVESMGSEYAGVVDTLDNRRFGRWDSQGRCIFMSGELNLSYFDIIAVPEPEGYPVVKYGLQNAVTM